MDLNVYIYKTYSNDQPYPYNHKDDFSFQYLKFSIHDCTKPSQDPTDPESMGSMECSLAEILAASSKARFERGLAPFRQTLGKKFTIQIF